MTILGLIWILPKVVAIGRLSLQGIHSLGANKVVYYLSRHHDERVSKFILLSPANVTHLTNSVSPQERAVVKHYVENGCGQKILPFELFGWLGGTADMAYQWLFGDTLNNMHVETERDFSQVQAVQHSGALLIGSLDRFTYGDPCGFLQNIKSCQQHSERARFQS